MPYINKQKVKADGTTNILCRITIDGKSTALSTGISCAPQDWNAKKGEIRNVRNKDTTGTKVGYEKKPARVPSGR